MAKRAKQADAKAAAGDNPIAAWLESYFGLKEQGTDIRTEFIAGLTTFLTMVYIVFVNPAILSKTGMDAGRGVRRHLRGRRGEHDGDGALRQLPDRARARHGHQRLLRLHCGADLQIHLAAGARRGVLLGRAVLFDFGVPHPAIRDRVRSRRTSSSRPRPASGCSSASSRWRKRTSWWRSRRRWSRSAT